MLGRKTIKNTELKLCIIFLISKSFTSLYAANIGYMIGEKTKKVIVANDPKDQAAEYIATSSIPLIFNTTNLSVLAAKNIPIPIIEKVIDAFIVDKESPDFLKISKLMFPSLRIIFIKIAERKKYRALIEKRNDCILNSKIAIIAIQKSFIKSFKNKVSPVMK